VGVAMEPPQAAKPALEIGVIARVRRVGFWPITPLGPLAHLSAANRSLPATAASEFG